LQIVVAQDERGNLVLEKLNDDLSVTCFWSDPVDSILVAEMGGRTLIHMNDCRPTEDLMREVGKRFSVDYLFLLYTEVARRTVHAIVSKPIERWEFVVGKYAGMALVLSVLVGVFAAAMAGTLAWQGVPLSPAIAKAIALAWVEVLVVAAIAIFFSSFSTPFLSGIFALGVWAIGRVTPDLERAAEAAAPAIRWTAKAAALILPDLHLFAVSGRTIDGEHVSVHAEMVSWAYVGMASLHGLGWIIGLLALAALLFHRRDFV
jgi:ABC-type transport system involved in multi-copper enzyme maturation permease subunit